jgi:hypothetical protein
VYIHDRHNVENVTRTIRDRLFCQSGDPMFTAEDLVINQYRKKFAGEESKSRLGYSRTKIGKTESGLDRPSDQDDDGLEYCERCYMNPVDDPGAICEVCKQQLRNWYGL